MTQDEKRLKDFMKQEDRKRAESILGKNQKAIDNLIKRQFTGKRNRK